MTTILRPDDEDGVRDVVASALADAVPLAIEGAGSKGCLGHPMRSRATLSLGGLSGIELYQPEELVLSARAGTPLGDIEAALEGSSQQLAFEPPDWGPLFGVAGGAATLGGVIACNLSGPRRIFAGAARDHLLGARVVTGRGEIVKTGGRVVKNVTGYDLCKLLAGSHGTLAAMTEITVKVLPRPEKTRTVLVFGLDDAAAIEALGLALSSPHAVSGAAHLPADIAVLSTVGYVRDAGAAVTALRIEGPEPSVAARCLALRDMLGKHGAVEELHFQNSRTLWAEIGAATPFAGVPDDASVLWRVSVPPAHGAALGGALSARGGAKLYYDWGGGLIWVRITDGGDDGGAGLIRGAIAGGGGHATLIRAPEALRAVVPVFQPQPTAVAALAERVREGFDPGRILNPGRMG
ncbi:MAG: FAD-binding protein [Alphaproteobacteria bacterium]